MLHLNAPSTSLGNRCCDCRMLIPDLQVHMSYMHFPKCTSRQHLVVCVQVTLLYTAPTAIRALQSFGNGFVTKYSRKSLRILGTVGEPINPEAWKWYHEVRKQRTECHFLVNADK